MTLPSFLEWNGTLDVVEEVHQQLLVCYFEDNSGENGRRCEENVVADHRCRPGFVLKRYVETLPHNKLEASTFSLGMRSNEEESSQSTSRPRAIEAKITYAAVAHVDNKKGIGIRSTRFETGGTNGVA